MKKAFLLKKTKKKVGKDVHVKGYVCGSYDSGGARTRPAVLPVRGRRPRHNVFQTGDQIVPTARTPKN